MRRVGMMMVLAFACLGAPLPAVAQASAPNTQLDACVAAAGASLPALQGCKGAVAEPRVEEPGGETTGGMAQCYANETRAWTALLDAAIAHANESATRARYFAQAQEAWRVWREAECRYQASLYEGGSLARVLAASCYSDLTADRAIALIYAERTEDM